MRPGNPAGYRRVGRTVARLTPPVPERGAAEPERLPPPSQINLAWHVGEGSQGPVPGRADLELLGAEYFNLPPFHDEPKFFHVAALLPGADDEQEVGRVGGTSWSLDRAMSKAAGEAIERLSAFPRDLPTDRILTPFDGLAGHALDPAAFEFAAGQPKPSRSDAIAWTSATQLTAKGTRNGLVPAQLVDLPYEAAPQEPLWMVPNSNGLAAGASLEHACWNAIVELVERDALFRSWFGATQPSLLSKKQVSDRADSTLAALVDVSRKYALEPTFFSLANSAGLAVIACVLRDVTGIGASSSIGMKSGPDLTACLIGALEEAHQLRPWLRDLADDDEPSPRQLRTIADRARWWVTAEAQDSLAVWTEKAVPWVSDGFPSTTLSSLASRLGDGRGGLWVVPLAPVVPRFSVVRAIAPALQAPFFDERHPAVLRELMPHDRSLPTHPLL